jgi:hypothetical protein
MKIIPGTRRTHEIIYLRCYLFPTSYKLLHIIILNWYNVNTFTIQSVLIAHAVFDRVSVAHCFSFLHCVFVFCVLCCPSSIYDFLFSLRYVHTFLVYVWFVPSVSSFFPWLCLVCLFGFSNDFFNI